MSNLRRCQILLEEEQYRRLRKLAAAADRSISDMTREVVTAGLKTYRKRQKRAMDALRKLDALRDEIRAQVGELRYDPVRAAREERAARLAPRS